VTGPTSFSFAHCTQDRPRTRFSLANTASPLLAPLLTWVLLAIYARATNTVIADMRATLSPLDLPKSLLLMPPGSGHAKSARRRTMLELGDEGGYSSYPPATARTLHGNLGNFGHHDERARLEWSDVEVYLAVLVERRVVGEMSIFANHQRVTAATH